MDFPIWLYNILVALFLLNASSLVVLFVGWLTHANYFYYLKESTDDIGIYIHSVFAGIFTFMGTIGFFVDDSPHSIFIGMIGANGIYILAILIMFAFSYLGAYITRIHNYFGEKRGRN